MLLSEIITMGGAPYPGMKREQLITFLRSNSVMPKRNNYPQWFYNIMKQCFNHTSAERPGFVGVGAMLTQALDEKKEVLSIFRYLE